MADAWTTKEIVAAITGALPSTHTQVSLMGAGRAAIEVFRGPHDLLGSWPCMAWTGGPLQVTDGQIADIIMECADRLGVELVDQADMAAEEVTPEVYHAWVEATARKRADRAMGRNYKLPSYLSVDDDNA